MSYLNVIKDSYKNDPTVENLIKILIKFNLKKILITWHISEVYWYIAGVYELNTNEGSNGEIDLSGIYTIEEPKPSLELSHVICNKTSKLFSDLELPECIKELVGFYLDKLELLDKINRQYKSQEIMLSNISHSIRTPLNGILHMTNLIASYKNVKLNNLENKTDDLFEYIDYLNNSTISLANNIFDIVDLTKLTLGKLILNYDNVKIPDLIESLKLLTNNFIKNSNVEIKFIIDENIPNCIYSDEKRMKQIIINLIENAILHTNLGQITIKISYNLETLSFKIEDTGVGMDFKTKEGLFKPLDLLVNAKQLGTSLRVSYMLANLLKGSLVLNYSELNKGSSFEFKIHCESTKIPSYTTLKQLRNRKILIVDQHSHLVDLSIFNKYEIQYQIANSYQEVSILHRDKKYELLVVISQEDPTLLIKALKTIINIPCLSVGTISKSADYHVNSINLLKYKLYEIFTELNINSHRCKLLNILVVEDEYINRIVIEKVLNKLGYNNITIAENGQDALQKINGHPEKFDLYLIDIRMPIMSGFELADEIYKLDSSANMIGVTAQVVINEDIKPYFNTFVYKPINIKELDKKIKQSLII
jgi:signal transduction histidine kinase